jgi:hypothetical protein
MRVEAVTGHLVAIELTVEPEASEVTVDGDIPIGREAGEPLYVSAGEHEIHVSADGYTDRELDVEGREGERVRLVVTLEPAPEVPPEETPPPKETPPPVAASPSAMPLFIGGGATATFGIAATVTGLMALSAHDTFADDTLMAAEREDARDRGKALALTTDLLTVGAVAGAAYTAYYYLAVYRPGNAHTERPASAGGRMWLTPFATARASGVALGGRF